MVQNATREYEIILSGVGLQERQAISEQERRFVEFQQVFDDEALDEGVRIRLDRRDRLSFRFDS